MQLLYIAIGIAAPLILLVIFLSYFAYRKVFYADRSKKRDPYSGIDKRGFKPFSESIRVCIDHMLSLEYERVEITSRDGLKLFARYYHVLDGAAIEIECHGYRSNSIRDFAGHAEECFKRWHNLLLVDQRSHGESEGAVISFGIRERFDIIDWSKYLTKRFGDDTKIFLHGISMGAASAIMAAGEKDLPDSVKGVIADCPYSSAVDIISKVGSESRIPGALAAAFAVIGARLFGRFSLTEADPMRAAACARIPILLLHGDADTFVPSYMSEYIKAKNEKIIFKKFDGADHAASYWCDTGSYVSLVNGFLDDILKEN